MSAATPSLPAWVREAAGHPVAFAQVREDPLIDRHLAQDCGTDLEIIQIASGGCTAALLATLPCVATLHLVDPNPAQLALARLKLWLLEQSPTDSRLAILGHAPMAGDARAAVLRRAFADLALPEDSLGPLAGVAASGPDHAGRYERVFAALRQHLAPVAAAIGALLALADPAEQRDRVAPRSPLGDALDQALDEVMALPHLVHLFGDSATRNATMPFSRHFAARLRHVLATLPAATNPYLWQLLAGAYPHGHAVDWFAQPRPQRLPPITWSNATMDGVLAWRGERFHLVHLSNILDWLSPAEATRTLAMAWQALRPGGRVVIRQLNSTLVIPDLEPRFTWMTDTAADLHRRDRSFFYRGLLVGRKP